VSLLAALCMCLLLCSSLRMVTVFLRDLPPLTAASFAR
jgi:hypothetical protein